jgi:cytochrome b pre-mRNA-processing protein 3
MPARLCQSGAPDRTRRGDQMALLGLLGRKRHERAGFELYTAAVRAARDPYIFEILGVPDTLDGRFDVIGLYVFLVVHRLHAASKEGKDLAQAVFDAMFSDMDINLREIGVGDMTVGKRVRAMWEAFNGRSAAYAAALDSGDVMALSGAVARNVWRGQAPPDSAHALAALAMEQSKHLADQPVEALLAGRVSFRPARATE